MRIEIRQTIPRKEIDGVLDGGLHTSRRQVLSPFLSRDGSGSYGEVLRQEFASSPRSTFEREGRSVSVEGVTHQRVVIQSDKGHAPYRATLDSLTVP